MVAKNILCDKLKSTASELYIKSNGDLIIICNNSQQIDIEGLVYQLRFLFAEDQLAYDCFGQEKSQFVSIFDLKNSNQKFAEKYIDGLVLLIAESSESTTLLNFIADYIEINLEKIKWDQAFKAKPIFVVFDNQPPRRIIEELVIDMQFLKSN